MSYQIKWNCNKQTNIDILLLKNGTILNTLAENIISVAGLNTWEWDTLELTPGDDYKIRIRKHDNPNIMNESVSAFTLGNSLVEGLIAFYKMNDNLATTNVIDETGNNNGICSVNTNTISQVGKFNRCFNFNSVDYVVVNGLSLGNSKSVSLWVWCESSSNAIMLIDGVSHIAIGFYNYNLVLSSYLNQRKAVPTGFNYNAWNHIVVNYDASDIPTCYINGNETTYTGLEYFDHNGGLWFGKRSSGTGFTGKLDNIRFYNRELTQEEIIDLYRE